MAYPYTDDFNTGSNNYSDMSNYGFTDYSKMMLGQQSPGTMGYDGAASSSSAGFARNPWENFKGFFGIGEEGMGKLGSLFGGQGGGGVDLNKGDSFWGGGEGGGLGGLNTGVNLFNSALQGYTTLAGIKQGNKALKQNKEQYQQQLALAKQTYNTSLEDKHRTRVGPNGAGNEYYDDLDTYLDKYRV